MMFVILNIKKKQGIKWWTGTLYPFLNFLHACAVVAAYILGNGLNVSFNKVLVDPKASHG